MIINLIDKSCVKILLFLALSPGSKYKRNELKNKTKLNNIPLDTALNKLVILSIIEKKNKFYLLNINSPIVKYILEEKKEISNIPLMVQYQLLDLIEKLIKFKDIKRIMLFGSYSKLIFSDKSDIDVAIIIKNKSKVNKDFSIIAKKISLKYKKSIHLHLFLEEDLKHKEDPLIKDILRNGRMII